MGTVALTEMVIAAAEEEEGMVVDGMAMEGGIAFKVGGVEGIRAITRMGIVRRGMIAVAAEVALPYPW